MTAETVTRDESKIPAEVFDDLAEKHVPDEDAQAGVRQAEAITLTWGKKSLATAYLL